MIVRSFQLSDYIPVQELLADVLSEDCYEETMVAFARQLTLDSELVLVAEINQDVVGILIGTIDENNHGYYYRIAVAKEHRHKGIGKALISKMRQRFELRKVSKIMVAADIHNQPVLPLYESLGFTPGESFRTLRIVNG